MLFHAKPVLSGFLVTCLLFVSYVGIVAQWQISEKIRYDLQDLLVRQDYRKHWPSELTQEVVLVAIRDSTYGFFNSRNPLDRAHLANVIESIRLQEPRLIALDFSFNGASNPESDEKLRAVFERIEHLFIASYYDDDEKYIRPFPMFAPYADFGTVNRIRDTDFRIRVSRSVHPGLSKKDTRFAIETLVAAEMLGSEVTFEQDRLAFIDPQGQVVHSVPVNVDGRMHMRYRIHEDDVTTIAAEGMLHPSLPKDLLKDKIVFMGSTGLIDHDHHATPLGTLPGVVILINALDTILKGDPLQPVPLHWGWLFLAMLGWLIAFITYRYPYWVGFISTTCMGVILAYACVLLFDRALLPDTLGLAWMLLGAFFLAVLHRSIAMAYEAVQLRVQATTDELTGIANFRFLQVKMDHLINSPMSRDNSLALIMFDMDGFKRVNDTHGHNAGNELLMQFTDLLKSTQRKKDIIARFGGDEFCVLIQDADAEQVQFVAERLRKAVEDRIFDIDGKQIRITLSIGAALFNGFKGKSAKQLFEHADKCLYESKEAGKNRVTFIEV